MQCSADTLRVRRGDVRVIDILVHEADGSFSVIGGAQVRWTYGPSPGRALVVKTQNDPEIAIVDVTIDGVARKVVRRTLPPAETAALVAFETYYFLCRLSFPGGPETVEEGTFIVDPMQELV